MYKILLRCLNGSKNIIGHIPEFQGMSYYIILYESIHPMDEMIFSLLTKDNCAYFSMQIFQDGSPEPERY
jgi:hypothetical protein